MDNQELIRKADITLSDLTDNGGVLNPEQSNEFIRKLLVAPTLIGMVRRVLMNAPERKVNKIQFNSRILHTAPDQAIGTTLADSLRSKPTTEQIKLNTHEYIAEVHLPYDVIEDNIERGNIGRQTDVGGSGMSGGFKDTIMELIAGRVAVDLEELSIRSDTASADSDLAVQDGWLKRASEHVFDAGDKPIDRSTLTQGMKALPKQYRRNRAGLRHFLTTEHEIDYRETIAQRETALGDSQLQSTAMVYGAGAPVMGVGLMPDNSGLLCDPRNLLFGVQRQIHMESDKDIRSRVFIIVVTIRCAFQIEEDDAVVRYRNVA